MAKNYYQYGKEIGIYPTPDSGTFSIGSVSATIADVGSSACSALGTFTGVKNTTYNIYINTTSVTPNTINWNDNITNPSQSIIKSSVTSDVVTAYVKNHGYSAGDKIRTYGLGAYVEKNIAITTVIDDNSFTYAHSAGDATSTGGYVWKWNAEAVGLIASNSLNNGISIVMLTSDSYGTNDRFTFDVTNTTGKTVRVHYHKEPAVLALNTDTPEIKPEHHEALVMYACKQLSRRLDFKRYSIYSGEWNAWHSKVVSSGKYIREESLQSTYRNY